MKCNALSTPSYSKKIMYFTLCTLLQLAFGRIYDDVIGDNDLTLSYDRGYDDGYAPGDSYGDRFGVDEGNENNDAVMKMKMVRQLKWHWH